MSVSDTSWTDVVTAIGTLALALAGVYAAFTWRRPMTEATKHETAAYVLEQARLFRYLFYDARSPLYTTDQFPPEYYTVSGAQGRTLTQEADGWAHLFANRWNLVSPQLHELVRSRARAGALLSDEVADAITDLARKGRELHGFMQHRVEQIRNGDQVVAQWPNQDWVRKVRESVEADPDPAHRDDAYSREFEEKFTKLERTVRPFL